jgi:prophage antirepressor-like protein
MIEIFKNEQFGNIRVAGTNEEPMFCLIDLCRALNLRTDGVLPRLKEGGYNQIGVTDSIGREQMTYFVNEQNMYRVIMRSDKQEAEKFQDWVCGEVLPSIRKRGMYATEDTIDKILSDPDFGIKLLTELKEERQKRIEGERKNAILMHVNKTYTMTEIAKELNLKSAIELNNKLSEMKIQFKTNKTWVLYSKYSNLGYEEIKQEILDNGRVVYHRKITQIGRDFIINLFKG